tara:strand:- start:268 stop:513 length:246 start_codon:yes stop_codon:yes gene_type:complete
MTDSLSLPHNLGQTEGLSKSYLFIHLPHRNLIMARQTIASLTAELEELRPLANGKAEAELREQQQALFILLAAVATIGFIF